jgi:hypothetical protein
MVKKVKKLSEEEIEEYKHENYQMMAAMSGKHVSELMGEPSSRPNFKHNYCLIKQMYLKNCSEPISSRQLYELLQNQGYKAQYNTFRGLVNNYMKYGYIRKVNAKKPFLYVLTDEGKLHAKNPYIVVDENLRKYNEVQNQKILEIINNDPDKFKEIYESVFGKQSFNNFMGFVASGGNSDTEINDDNHYTDEQKHEIEGKIYDKDFWKDADFEKITELIKAATFEKLNSDQCEMMAEAILEARDTYKGSMILQQPVYSKTKPEGERHYYKILANNIGNKVTKEMFEKINYKFFYIKSTREVRLKYFTECGLYRNNNDAEDIVYERAVEKLFKGNMIITKENNGKELVFYYSGGRIGRCSSACASYKITTMSYDDYHTATENVNVKQKVNIITQNH